MTKIFNKIGWLSIGFDNALYAILLVSDLYLPCIRQLFTKSLPKE